MITKLLHQIAKLGTVSAFDDFRLYSNLSQYHTIEVL